MHATGEHCDLPIYSDWEKFNSAAYKKGGMSPLDPSEVLRQKASSLNAVLAVSILLFMLIGTLTIAFGVAPTAYPNDIHLPANLADKWRTVLYPSGKPLKLFRAGGDFSVFASSWRALLPIFMFALYLTFRRQGWSRWGVKCLLAYIAISILTPLNPLNQPAPPEAVSLAAAKYALAQDRSLESTSFGAYVRAQIAFIEGRKLEAKRLADSIRNEDRLESPFEAPWRLQYLRQKPVSLSTVCWLSGCVSIKTVQISNFILRAVLPVPSALIIILLIARNKIYRRSKIIENVTSARRRHITELSQAAS